MKNLIIIFVVLLLPITVFGQETLDDLLDAVEEIVIVTASKKAESVFDAPLSSSVVTRQMIENSGATSIPDALRLVPGLIVREQTAGNYDIHLRGFGNIPPHSTFLLASNTITLVMIDNRPVYNYFAGGTFWETLPIDLGDIDRIEVVRGPSAALYGPNAVAGVINIITRQPQQDDFHLNANIQGGTEQTQIGNIAFDYKQEQFDVIISANGQKQDRHQNTYYEFKRNIYTDSDSILNSFGFPYPDLDKRYPDPDLAVEKYGLNSFLNYYPSENVHFGLGGGYQDSKVQKIFVDNSVAPITTNESETSYIDAKATIFDLLAHVSWMAGEQVTNGLESWQYDFNTIDCLLEYDYHWNNLGLKPGVSYRRAEYDGSFIGGSQELETMAFFLRSDYTRDRLRLVGAIRGDKYNYPDETYLSFQLASTYKINENHLVRTAFSQSNASPFMVDTYLDFSVHTPTYKVEIVGNKALDLLRMKTIEFGYRTNYRRLTLDLEGFVSQVEDYIDFLPVFNGIVDSVFVSRNQSQNLKLSAQQVGVTGQITYQQSNRLKVDIFGTVQKTEIEDHQPDITKPDSLINMDNKFTPSYYGGMYINYKPTEKINLNLNPYFYGEQTFHHNLRSTDVEAKFIMNAKVSYQLQQNISFYINGRNVFNDDTKEYPFADDIKGTYLAGMQVEF